MQSRLTDIATAGTLSIFVGVSTAFAGSVTQPGETVGIAAGSPLSPGLYFANTADWGCRNTTPASCLGITIPIVTWSTPWTFLGARVQFFSVTPLIETGVEGDSYNASVFNPALLGQLAWDLGSGFGFSYAFGAYSDVDQSVAFSSTSLNQRFAVSYTGNDWNLTANVIYGIQLDQVQPAANLPLSSSIRLQRLQSGFHQYRPDRYQKVWQMADRTGGLRFCRPRSSDWKLSATSPVRGWWPFRI